MSITGLIRASLKYGLACLLLIGTVSTSWAEPSAKDTYQLGAGDKIDINVFGEDDLSLTTTLGQKGVINYPYLGSIKAAGMSIAELEEHITTGLKGDYLIQPSVHVSVVEYRPFYIYGEVQKPGGYPYQPNLTLERAVALAGGFTERASKQKMNITRTVEGAEQELPAKLGSSIQPGDSILIQDSFF